MSIATSKTPSQVKEFSPDLWERLQASLRRAVDQATKSHAPLIAAFDADGTLWDSDAGETFFDWQIQRCGFANLPADPWNHYHELKKMDPITAYVWLAQISAGAPLEQVRAWAQQCFSEQSKWPVFESQAKLIQLLREYGFEIYIVTASIKWAVEPVASLVGVDFDHVIGITTKLVDGKIGMEANHPITWRQGKADGLLAATGGARPILASGNTLGDIALLETATEIQLAISTQIEPGGLFDEEAKLAEVAEKRGWLRHRFR